MDENLRAALARDETIDITTTGRNSGEPRMTEIWYRRVDGRYYITGTPRPRDWYANLLVEPDFVFTLKQSVHADLAATARPVVDPEERSRVLRDQSMSWYHDRAGGAEALIESSPLVEVIFKD
ncbi:MAG: nitroreductase/quinone reductase family protein [Acidimicrobiales bacterium]